MYQQPGFPLKKENRAVLLRRKRAKNYSFCL